MAKDILIKILQAHSETDDTAGPLSAIFGKGPWFELGKNMPHFGLFWDFFWLCSSKLLNSKKKKALKHVHDHDDFITIPIFS